MRGGPSLIAAVCARDHWDKMSPDDRDWCIDKLVREVEQNYDTEDEIARHGRGAYQPDRQAAYVLPGLLARNVSEAQTAQIKEAIAKALTHAVEEVVMYAAKGIGVASTGKMRAFSEACIAAIAWRARLISDRLAEERARTVEIIREVVPAVRAAIIAQDRDPQTEVETLALIDWPGIQAGRIILKILAYVPDSGLAVEFYRRIANSIMEDWEQKLEDRSLHREPDHDFNHDYFQLLARFVLKLKEERALYVCEPFLASVARHPNEIYYFVRDLVFEADRSSVEDSFWSLWQAFANALCAAPWIKGLDSRYSSGKELVGAIFLRGYWKENIRHWRRLEGQGHRVDELAERFRGSVAVFKDYCQFLYEIGESSLPYAFIFLAESLAAGDPTVILADRNTVFLLESLLRRYVHAEPYKLKSEATLRTAVLALLDYLVEAGSSAAYRMRDDFVTPLSGPVGG